MRYRYATNPSLISKSISKPIYIFSCYTRERCRYGRGCIYAHSPDELKEWQQEYDRKMKEKIRKELEEEEEIGSLELASKILKGPAEDVSHNYSVFLFSLSPFFNRWNGVLEGLQIHKACLQGGSVTQLLEHCTGRYHRGRGLELRSF